MQKSIFCKIKKKKEKMVKIQPYDLMLLHLFIYVSHPVTHKLPC